MKKSYNPFKMWGAWLGAVITLALGITYTLSRLNNYDTLATISIIPLFPISWLYNIFANMGAGVLVTILGNSVVLIYGFLVGWGIHSLIRSVRK